MENEAVVAAEKPEGEENVVEKENPEKEAEVEPEEKVCSIFLQSSQVLRAL